MQPRTQRQREILDYITRFIERHGYEPSYAQIARHFGVSSKATIAKHIAALESRGLLSRRSEDGTFNLEVKVEDAPSDAICELQLLGRVAAGDAEFSGWKIRRGRKRLADRRRFDAGNVLEPMHGLRLP